MAVAKLQCLGSEADPQYSVFNLEPFHFTLCEIGLFLLYRVCKKKLF